MNHAYFGNQQPTYLNGTKSTAAANIIMAAAPAGYEYVITDITLIASEAQTNTVQLGNAAGTLYVNTEFHAAGHNYQEQAEPYHNNGDGQAIVLTLSQAKQVRYHLRFYMQPVV